MGKFKSKKSSNSNGRLKGEHASYSIDEKQSTIELEQFKIVQSQLHMTQLRP